VLTSNVGSRLLARGAMGLGFQIDGGDEAAVDDDAAAAADSPHARLRATAVRARGVVPTATARVSRVRGLVMEELKGVFRPEFLNRLDDIVVRTPRCGLGA
jgi:ATP-dependent Clp protease ATP-binding subunit ClpA